MNWPFLHRVLLGAGVFFSGLSPLAIQGQTSLEKAGPDKIRIVYRPDKIAAAEALVHTCLVGIPAAGEVRLEVVEVVEAVGPSWADPWPERSLGGPARLGAPGFVRDQRVVELVFEPRRQGDGRLRGYRRVVVDIWVDPQAAASRQGPRPDRWGEDLLRHRLINYHQARSWRLSVGGRAKRAQGPNDPLLVRMVVQEQGMHRVTGADLEAIGVDLEAIDPNGVRVYYGGGQALPTDFVESPLIVERGEIARVIDDGGDGRFDVEDAVVFYGEPVSRFAVDETGEYHYLNNLYTDENIYWLGLGGTGEGLRGISLDGGGGPAAAPLLTSARQRLHREQEAFIQTQASGNINSGLDWYWQAFRNTVRNFSIEIQDPVDEPVDMRFAFIGWTAAQHRFLIRWNDEDVEQISFNGRSKFVRQVQAERGPQEGQNLLGVVQLDFRTTRFDWYELEYSRALRADQGEVSFAAPVQEGWARYQLDGFTQAPRLFRADAGKLAEITGWQFEADEGRLVFADSAGIRPLRYAAVAPGGWHQPARLELDSPSSLRALGQGAEYLIITHGDFAQAAQRLAAWRSRDSRFGPPLTSQVVDVQDIYDEFSGGLVDPAALRNFLQWAYAEWDPAPFFVLLLGDGTYDYKNNSGLSLGNWIPAYQDGDSTYDEWFVRVVGDDHFPDMAIGRISVQTAAEAAAVVDKLIDYDQAPEVGPWQSRGLVVADDIRNPSLDPGDTTEAQFVHDAEFLAETLLAGNRDLTKHYIGLYPLQGLTKPEARDEFLRLFNQGSLFVTYVGHGNRDVLAHEQIFVLSRDIDQLANGRRLPFLYTAASQVGVFDDPVRTSMPEVLLKRPDGGVIGMIAATRIGFHQTNMRLAFIFHEIMYDPERPAMTVGQALMEAKQSVQVLAGGPYGRRNVQRYSLFGDPALRLAQPPLQVQLSVGDTLPALGEVTLQGQVVNAQGQEVALEGEAWIQAFDSSIPARVEGLEYQQLGSPLFRGRVPVRQGRLGTTFRVPKDINYQGAQGRISAFVSGAGTTAFGVAQGLVFTGTATDIPADGQGPQIELGFAQGQATEPGFRVGRRPLLQVGLRDDSGINITGETGHDIQVSVDGHLFKVTDRFVAGADYRAGSLELALPALAPGLHQVEVKAWDSFNNSGSARVQVEVGEGVANLLSQVLFHPNPLQGEAGHFTFELAESSSRVVVAVYTLSGREVASWETSGVRGFNRESWAPAGDLANGTYLYRLRALGPDGRWDETNKALQILR
ncbi:MAG: type IX secretion system sortase PorU [Candidatus Latescibacteria bacterium]|nr:type IX secretion system sortase PorU [Candidatus Latescibacterota bacterium]